MPIDASIPLMGKPIEIENPVNALAKIQQLNTLSRQNALADIQLQNMQQTMADQRQLRQVATDAFDPASGKLDNKKLRSGLASMGAYQQLQELDNAELNRLEKQGKIDKSTIENAQLKFSLLGQTAGALRASGASRDQVVEAVGSLARDGVIPSEEAVQMISRIPSDPAALNQWLHQAQLWALDAKSQLPTYTTTDVGGQVLVREQVPGKAPTTVGSLKKSPTPGEQMTNQRGWAELGLKQQELAMGGKPPPGYRWTPEGNLAAIPGGPGDKLSEAQTKQVLGIQNLQNAITEYRNELKDFPATGIVSPDQRARMGTFYNNMMLQAKEAYNLGVLNGPDFNILTSIITDPRSIKGAMTSKSALDTGRQSG